MILVKEDILKALSCGDLGIENAINLEEQIGTNSIDLHIDNTLMVYTNDILDCAKKNETKEFEISEEGFLLLPNKLYLASTLEKTFNKKYIPIIWGKSSLARLGLAVHRTAGFGDVGFDGHWTLQLSVIKPLIIYPFEKIAQIVYFKPSQKTKYTYDRKLNAKYNNQGNKPVSSKMNENFK